MNPATLVRLREAQSLTQHEVAERVGVSHRQYARWEAGEQEPRPKNRRAIAKALGVDLADLQRVAPEPDDVQAILARIEERLKRIEARLDHL